MTRPVADESNGALTALRTQLAGETGLEEAVVPAAPEATTTVFGDFVASGQEPDEAIEYAILIEAIREGYLLHYGSPRLFVSDLDPDLALLAGDFLYAIGLERLSRLSNVAAVRELSDLITLQAAIHSDGAEIGTDMEALDRALWLATSAAVACGGDEDLEDLKSEIPDCADPRAVAERLLAWSDTRVRKSGVDEAWTPLREQVGFGIEAKPPGVS